MCVQVYKSLEGQNYWLQMLDWIGKMDKQQGPVSRHPDFEWVDTQLHELLAGGQSGQSQAGSSLQRPPPIHDKHSI